MYVTLRHVCYITSTDWVEVCYIQKNSWEGSRALGYSKPTTYVATPCGRWSCANPGNEHEGGENAITLACASRNAPNSNMLPPKKPQLLELCRIPMVSYKYVQVGLRYTKHNKPPSSTKSYIYYHGPKTQTAIPPPICLPVEPGARCTCPPQKPSTCCNIVAQRNCPP